MAAPRRLSPPGSATPRAGHVREYRPEDLPAVAALRRRAFRTSERDGIASLSEYLHRMFDHAAGEPGGLTSLVYEDADGEVVGFQGVVEREMTCAGRSVRVAVGTQLMVAPEHRGVSGQALLRSLLAGPQDLTLSDVGNDVARRLWKGLGGESAPFHTYSWTETIRPLRHQANEVVARGAGWLPRAAMFAVRPAMAAGDAILTRRRPWPPGSYVVPLDPTAMALASETVLEGYTLRPSYTPERLAWLLEQLREKRQFGELEGGIVMGGNDEVAGWFLYYRNGGGECEVIQVAARARQRTAVLDLLAAHARDRGAVALTGRIDPAMLPELAERQVTLRHEGAWVLFHTPRPAIAKAIREGDAFLSRLDGEWWMSF